MGLMSLEETVKNHLHVRKDAHFMMVDGMFKLMTDEVDMCESSDFNVSGLEWMLLIDWDEATEDSVPIRLKITDKRCSGSNWEVNCRVKISLISLAGHISKSFVSCFKEHHVQKRYNISIPHEVFKAKYIVKDKAVFCVEITNVEANFPVSCIARTMGTAERVTLKDVPRKDSRFTWKITQFSSFIGKEHSSHEFTMGQRRWKIEMFPKGNTDEGHLSLYLTATGHLVKGPKRRTLAIYKLRVLDQLRGKHHETGHEAWFHYDAGAIESSWGDDKFLPLEELNDSSRGFLVNDVIYLGVEFLIISTTDIL